MGIRIDVFNVSYDAFSSSMLVIFEGLFHMILFCVLGRYFSGFDAQEACHWRQEEGLEEEEKVSHKEKP